MGKTLTVEEIVAADARQRVPFSITWRPSLNQYSKLYSLAIVGCSLSTPCMLAAIVNRESSGQNIFQRGVPRGPGCGVGLCQITADVDWPSLDHPMFKGKDLLNPANNLAVAAHYFLEPALTRFPTNHIAAFAAFNLGGGGVQNELAKGLDPDTYTTEHDYGHDVFTNYVNFAAVSLKCDVAWSEWKQAA